ncbi:MAG: cytochrome P450 [Myxococcota bacterium]|nr:cytochrome P450 [Myxococcota bacterium]
MINLDDPEHKHHRNLVNRGFTPKRLLEHEIKIRRICNQLIDSVCERGECEFVREIAAPLPLIMIGDMLGMPEEDFETLLNWSETMLRATDANASNEIRAAAGQAGLEWFQYAMKTMVDRRSKPTGDLVSELVYGKIDGVGLTDEQIAHETLLILVGGDETTRHVITEGMLALIEYPEERAQLLARPDLLPSAIEEMLRWVSPIKNMNRTVTQDTILRGQRLKEGDRLLLLYQSGNRDELVFDQPDQFQIGRSPNHHVAFGGYGSHHCLGASLARLELKILFEELMRRLPDISLQSDAPLPRRESNFIVGIERMPVRFSPGPREGTLGGPAAA